MAKAPKRAVSRKTSPAPPADILHATAPTLHPSHQDISARAYQLFLRRGATHGHDYSDWFAAERELTEDVGPAPIDYAG
jgi:hypothetical protein